MLDVSDDDFEQPVDAVTGIRRDLEPAEKPRLLAFNKLDRAEPEEAQRRARAYGGLLLSALDRETLAPLLHSVENELWKEGVHLPKQWH